MVPLPLQDIRVLDLGQVYAGPLAGRILADMGAEVIRIESAIRSTRGGSFPQSGATYPNSEPGKHPYNRSAYYNEINRNKLAISLNLSKSKGKSIFRRLVRISDVVLENFTPRVMANFGLDYSNLSQVNPRIIMISISAYGQTGPHREYISYGRGIEAMSGLADITGYIDAGPIGPGIAYADATGGLHAALAVLLAIRQRVNTGQGQHIDLSLQESLVCLLGEHITSYSMNRNTSKREGNQESGIMFQGCFRCLGNDAWVTITICSENEWRQLGTVVNNLPNTLEDSSDANRIVEDWTSQYKPSEAMHLLQTAGVPAGAVHGTPELFNDPHLLQRGFFQQVSHSESGTYNQTGLPWKINGSRIKIRKPAPCFAEHHRYVFGELLGMKPDEILALEESGIASRIPIR